MAQQLSGTLNNFITRVRRYLNEDTATKSRWDDDFLKHLFNTQYRLRCAELYMAHEGYFTIVATRDVVANQNRYAWPSGFQRLLKMELVREDGRRVPIQRQERHYHVLQIPNSGGDEWLPDYRPVGSGFMLEPASNVAVTNGLRLEYAGVPEELTDDGDTLHSDFPAMLDEILVLDTVMVAMDAERFLESNPGQVDSIQRQRMEWQVKWERFIDGRMVSRQQVTPFATHYSDA
jgi:hypothetical protein